MLAPERFLASMSTHVDGETIPLHEPLSTTVPITLNRPGVRFILNQLYDIHVVASFALHVSGISGSKKLILSGTF